MVGVRGEGLEFVVSASAVSADGAVVTGGRLLSVGGNGIPPSAHCVPAAGGAFVSVRLPAIEQPGAYTLVMQRSPLFGIGRSDEKATLHVIASHGFLNPRQAESSEGARMGEERTFTLAGRQLGGLRVRSGAAALQGAGAPITDVQWMSPDQSQVRIRLTLHRVGLVPLSELFEFIGSGESPVNRDLGWPVIDVLP
ncbi:MAG: hypothetical protein DCF27_03695 [Lysobacteraceae bacterium]|nr:MAG: hypothetical protein DCF27_03695 [Xanthomonadaceae bacterium]